MNIIITTNHPESKNGVPVCLIDGELVDGRDGFIHCYKSLGWSRTEASEKLGKKANAVDNYRRTPNPAPVPAEVWIRIGQELKKKGLGVLDIG